MKEWLAKIRGSKNAPLLLLALCLGAALLLSAGTEETGLSMTEEERRFSAALSAIQGAGKTKIAISYAPAESAFSASSSRPVGAIIISEGAGDIAVRLQLLRAAETLLQLPAEQVEIFPMEAEHER